MSRMDPAGRKILLEGRPGIGKTTVIREAVDLLLQAGRRVRGFTTEEIREGGRRMGFRVEAIGGRAEVMAHVGLAGEPRVGRYGVDVAAFERVALPELRRRPGEIVVIDELGRMELACPAFRREVERVFHQPGPVVASVQLARHPFTDRLKADPAAVVWRVHPGNRRELAAKIVAEILPASAGPGGEG